MDKHTQKVVLWFLLLTTIAAMSVGVYLTHPIRNFNFTELKLWIVISLVILPSSFFIHHLVRQKWLFKLKNDSSNNIKNSIASNKHLGDWAVTGCDPIGCIPLEGEFAIIFIFFLVASVAASLIGIIAGILLLVIEILISKLFDLDPYQKPHILIWILNTMAILYATYFIALFITIRFFQ